MRRGIIGLVLTATLVGGAGGRAKAQTLAQWNVQSAGPGQNSGGSVSQSVAVSPNYSVTSLIRGSGFTDPGAVNGFYATGLDSATIAAANTVGEYYQFTITPSTGLKLQFTSLTWTDVLGPGNTGNVSVGLRSDANGDNFQTDISFTGGVFASNANIARTASLTGISSASAVRFRLYAYNSGNSANEFGLIGSPVVLSGSTTGVPEPPTRSLLLLTALPLIYVLRRRSRVAA